MKKKSNKKNIWKKVAITVALLTAGGIGFVVAAPIVTAIGTAGLFNDKVIFNINGN